MSNVVTLKTNKPITSFKTIDDYPDIMQAKDVQEYLGISNTTAYEILNSKNCPTLHMGRRKAIAKDSFLRFLRESEGKQLF